MTHCVRGAFGRVLASGLALAVALLVAATSLAAQGTAGKIEGTVTDPQGAPIANAQVTIVGTSFGALTSDKGYYFINNVPSGVYTLRARFIGYTPAEVPGVRVQAEQTLTQNIRLTPSAVAIGPVTIEAAARPLVPRDQVTSKVTLFSGLVRSLPVDDVRGVLQLAPGVVETNRVAGVSIRGGRPGEANVYIDGAPVRSTNMGGQRITVGTNAVEEASVTTGALGVEFSDAQSGVISYTTRAGGPKLSGALSAETDEPFGDAISIGFNRYEGSIGGPVPRVPNLTWFASGVVQGRKSAPRGMDADEVPLFVLGGVDAVVQDPQDDGTVKTVVLPRYVQFSGQCGEFGKIDAATLDTAASTTLRNNYGYECQGNRRPMDWQTRMQGSGKLQYTYGSGSSVSLTGVFNSQQDRFTPVGSTSGGTRDAPTRFLGTPAMYRGQHLWQRLAVLNINHQVTRAAERALAVNLNVSWARDRSLVGPLAPQSELETRDPTLGITFKTLQFSGIDQMPFPITEQIVRNVRNNSGLRAPYLNRSDVLEGETKRLNPYGLAANQWVTGGLETRVSSLSETRYTGRLVVDWQANRYHRFTLGGDAKKTDLAFYDSRTVDQFFQDVYVGEPVQYGLFAADRLDLGDLVLELGLRWDYYNAKSLFSNTPGFIFSHPEWDLASGTDDAAYATSLARVFTPSTGHYALSPRLRVSFPVTERTGFRLSYAHQVQTPDYETLLSGTNNDIESGNTNQNDEFGRDVRFGKTILFEFGVRHAFSQDMVLDVSAYNKDKMSDLAYRTVRFVKPTDVTDTIQPNILTNRDFGTSRGVDVRFDRRWGNYLNATVAYTFQVAKGTGSDPSTYLDTFARQVSALSGDRTPPPEAAQRTNNDRTHSITGSLALTVPTGWKSGTTLGAVFRDVGAFLTFRVLSGLPYPRIINQGDGQLVPFADYGLGGRIEEGEPLNGAVTPWTRYLDLRVNKGVRLGRVDVTAYADVRNLFNFRNIEQLFNETGDVVNPLHEINEVGDPVRGTGEYLVLWNEARDAGALEGRSTVNLTGGCSSWDEPLSCESLKRVEQRFGNGDGKFTEAEQAKAWGIYYDSVFGSWRMYGEPRRVRVGFELNF